MEIGKIIGGGVGENVKIRLERNVDIGDIVIAEENGKKFFMKIVDIFLSSQIPNQFVEDMASRETKNIFDKEERFYKIGVAKILKINNGAPRDVPNFFTNIREIEKEDLEELKFQGEIEIGKLRLGSKVSDISVFLPAEKLISHHMLVVAATGRGKSNFAKVFLKGLTETEKYSSIVFDPHSEYYGKGSYGLGDLNNTIYYTPSGKGEELKIYAEDLSPFDFIGIVELSDAQKEAMILMSRMKDKINVAFEGNENIGKCWINIFLLKSGDEIEMMTGGKVKKGTAIVLKRRLMKVLDIREENGELFSKIFSTEKRKSASIFEKILENVRNRKTVIVDTSMVGEDLEKIISSSILNRVFDYYRFKKQENEREFESLPEVLVVFEEAPRVLSNDVGDKNVFERVAREGRKFKIGLCAITQMPSLIPAEILSQMNTKVILGIPSPEDRKAVVNSSSQNISDETKEIQMLDVGEALITSPFVDFPLPVKIYKFDNIINKKKTDFVI